MKNWIKNNKYLAMFVGFLGIALVSCVVWEAYVASAAAAIPEESWWSPSTWGNSERLTALSDSAALTRSALSVVVVMIMALGSIAVWGLQKTDDRINDHEEWAKEDDAALKRDMEKIEALEKRLAICELALDEPADEAKPEIPAQLPPTAEQIAAHAARHPRQKAATT